MAGSVDANGRYWVGTMNDPLVVDGNITDEGVLFRLDPDLSLHRIMPGLSIPNGMSWTNDDKTMYLTDSPSGHISQYPFDPVTGELSTSKGKPFFTVPFEDAVPDGHCRDAEGYFWVACFGAGKVVRVSPQGKIVAEVHLPTRCVSLLVLCQVIFLLWQISCPVLCGTDLIITSAEEEAPDKFPDSVKHQGAVFKVNVGVGPGKTFQFKLAAES